MAEIINNTANESQLNSTKSELKKSFKFVNLSNKAKERLSKNDENMCQGTAVTAVSMHYLF